MLAFFKAYYHCILILRPRPCQHRDLWVQLLKLLLICNSVHTNRHFLLFGFFLRFCTIAFSHLTVLTHNTTNLFYEFWSLHDQSVWVPFLDNTALNCNCPSSFHIIACHHANCNPSILEFGNSLLYALS